MKKKSKLLKIFLLFGLICCCIIGKLFITESTVVSADSTTTYYSIQEYTNSDKLLQENGTESSKTIRIFANEVNSALIGADCSEITQVIPRQFLEATVENVTYRYMGEEYGFYMVKEGEFFDLLLIDFVYEFLDGEEHNNEYKIRIEPILQESFMRESSDNGYVFRKYNSNLVPRYKYYVANPRFLSTLQNEHALNYGDSGYNKASDEGLIIQQCRTNYGKISYKTASDGLALLAEFTFSKAIDIFLPSVVGDIKDTVEFHIDAYNQGKEVTAQANNEANILTNQSKSDQLNNPDQDGYFRSVAFSPKEEVILSEADDSYAECIIMVNDTNYASRLMQYCDFEIVRRIGNWSSMEYVQDTSGNNAVYSLDKQRTLFDTAYSLNKNMMSYYLLNNGEQTFEFQPEFSGPYMIKSNNANVFVAVNGNYTGKTEYGQALTGGKQYQIAFYSRTKNQGIGTIEVVEFTTHLFTMPTGQSWVFSFTPIQAGVYAIEGRDFDTGNSVVSVAVYGNLFGEKVKVDEAENGLLLVHLKAGVEYFTVFYNNTGGSVKWISICELANLEVLSEYKPIRRTLEANRVYYYQFQSESLEKYNFDFSNADVSQMSFNLKNQAGEMIVYEKTVAATYTQYRTIEALDYGTYYVRVQVPKNTVVDININRHVESYYWKIDGIKYNGLKGVRRGVEHTLVLYNSYGDIINYESLTINETYSQLVDLSRTVSGYTFIIQEDALMYSDIFNVYCTFYANMYDGTDIHLTFPVIFQEDKISLSVLRTSANSDYPSISFPSPAIGTETAKIYCTYTLDDGVALSDSFVFTSTDSALDVSTLASCSDAYLYITSFSIDYIEIYVGNAMWGLVYNRALTEYKNKKNNVYIEPIEDIPLRFYGGAGTEASPYLIKSYRHFNNIRHCPSRQIFYFSLLTNITLPTTFQTFGDFYGIFNGNGYKIYNLQITIPASGAELNYGLFGNNYGTIKNLTLQNVNIINSSSNSSNYSNVGAIAGSVFAYSYIINCKVINVTMDFEKAYLDRIGGIAGFNSGFIEGCMVTNGTFTASCHTGGIVGYNTGEVKACRVQGTINVKWVKQSKAFGGIAGCSESVVKNCEFAGMIYFYCPESERMEPDVLPMVGYIVGWNYGGTQTDNAIGGAGYDYSCYYFWPIFDQSDRLFKVDEGRVGYQGT